MNLPPFLQGDSLKSHIAAVALGAVLVAFGGFKFAGWYTDGQANVFAERSAAAAVVQALTPVCVASWKNATPEARAEFNAKEPYGRSELVRKTAVLPGVDSPIDYALASACADALTKAAKSAQK